MVNLDEKNYYSYHIIYIDIDIDKLNLIKSNRKNDERTSYILKFVLAKRIVFWIELQTASLLFLSMYLFFSFF